MVIEELGVINGDESSMNHFYSSKILISLKVAVTDAQIGILYIKDSQPSIVDEIKLAFCLRMLRQVLFLHYFVKICYNVSSKYSRMIY